MTSTAAIFVAATKPPRWLWPLYKAHPSNASLHSYKSIGPNQVKGAKSPFYLWWPWTRAFRRQSPHHTTGSSPQSLVYAGVIRSRFIFRGCEIPSAAKRRVPQPKVRLPCVGSSMSAAAATSRWQRFPGSRRSAAARSNQPSTTRTGTTSKA